MNEPQVGRT